MADQSGCRLFLILQQEAIADDRRCPQPCAHILSDHGY